MVLSIRRFQMKNFDEIANHTVANMVRVVSLVQSGWAKSVCSNQSRLNKYRTHKFCNTIWPIYWNVISLKQLKTAVHEYFLKS